MTQKQTTVRFLYIIHVYCSLVTFDRLMGGDGDYYMTSSQLMSQQAQGSASSAMYNMMSGVSANMYPTTMSYFDPSVYAMPQDNPNLTTNSSAISPSSGLVKHSLILSICYYIFCYLYYFGIIYDVVDFWIHKQQ